MVLSAKSRKMDQMIDFSKTEHKRKKLKFKLDGLTLVIVLLLGFIIYSFSGQMVEIYNVQNQIENLQDQIEELNSKNASLRKQIDQLSSDAYIEREAREKLGLVKPGEKLIIEAKPGEKGSVIPTKPDNIDAIEAH